MNAVTAHLVELMSEASGFDEQIIMGKGRQRPLPACRWMIGAVLVDRGYSSAIAAREIGLDHATLLYGRKALRGMTRRGRWGIEIDIMEKFNTLLDREA